MGEHSAGTAQWVSGHLSQVALWVSSSPLELSCQLVTQHAEFKGKWDFKEKLVALHFKFFKTQELSGGEVGLPCCLGESWCRVLSRY